MTVRTGLCSSSVVLLLIGAFSPPAAGYIEIIISVKKGLIVKAIFKFGNFRYLSKKLKSDALFVNFHKKNEIPKIFSSFSLFIINKKFILT